MATNTTYSDILANMSNVGLEGIMKQLQDLQLQPTQQNVTTLSQQSPYKFEDWATAKGYNPSIDSVSGTYKLNNVEIPKQITSLLQGGYGTEHVYENILTSYKDLLKSQQDMLQTTTAGSAEAAMAGEQPETQEYVSPYEEEINQLMEELKTLTPYQSPEELQQYLYQLLQSANQPFTYDPTQDEALKQAQQEAGRQVREAQAAKGTLYSSGTIGKTARQQAALVPQFEAQKYQRFADARNRELNMMSTLMQWDEMQANRYQDQLDLVQTKFDYILKLDSQEFEKFQVMLEQRNFEKGYQLEQQALQLEKQIQEIEQAYARVDAIGYVDSKTAIILGLPVGTPAQWVKELEMAQQQELERLKKEHDNDVKLQKEQAKIEKDLVKYKNELEEASKRKLMKEQYEYDKKLQKEQHRLEKQLATGGGVTASSAGIIATAKSLSGLKYVWGGTSTTKGMDCSGFTQWVFKQHGVDITRTTQTQVKQGKWVSRNNLQAGDLVFFNTSRANGHVGIYIGNNQVIHASTSGKKVQVNSLSYFGNSYSQARRILGTSAATGTSGSGGGTGISISKGRNVSNTSTKNLQRTLNSLGITDSRGKKLTEDGDYGKLTTSAVVKLQKKLGVSPDGVFGPQTEKALKNYLNKNSSTKKTSSGYSSYDMYKSIYG